MTLRTCILALAVCFSVAGTAMADTVVLNFEGIASNSNPDVAIGNFYNGGGGPANNYGITFSSNALALCLNSGDGKKCGGSSNTSRGGQGDPTSAGGALFFLNGSQTYMDDPAGFKSGFSLFYTAIGGTGDLGVYSGLDGTGTLLGSLTLPATSSTCAPQYDATFCPFVPVGLSFSGTAESIQFAGVDNGIVFDDVTFGSATPGTPAPSPAPEPSTFMLLGIGLIGVVAVGKGKLLNV